MRTRALVATALMVISLASCQKQHPDTEIAAMPETGDYRVRTLQDANSPEYRILDSGDPGVPGGSVALPLGGTSPKTFNYWAATDTTSTTVAGLMYSGLLARHPWSGEILPDLARSYRVEAAGKRIVVELRRGIRWSDGEPIDAEDVLFTWNTILKKGLERLGARESVLVEGEFPAVEAIDRYTIAFETSQVFAPLLSELTYPIAPEHYFRPALDQATQGLSGDKALKRQRRVFATMMGPGDDPETFVVSGPYLLDKYRPRERIEYRANPRYWTFDGAGQRLPYLERLAYVVLPSSDLQFFKFVGREIPYLSGLSPEDLRMLAASTEGFSAYRQPADGSTVFAAFNLAREDKVGKWFQDRRFREALGLAVDRQAMVETVFLGAGQPLCSMTSRNSIYFHRELLDSCNLRPRLEEARELLRQAGFSWDAQGQLTDGGGGKVELDMYTNSSGGVGEGSSPRELMAQLLREQWSKLGVTLNVKTIEFNNLVVRIMQTGDWETVIMGLSGGDPYEPNSSANVWRSDGKLHLFDQRPPGRPITDRRDWEAELDANLARGTRHLNREDRRPYYERIQEIIWHQKPLIPLATGQNVLAVRDGYLGNFRPSPLAGTRYNLEQWYRQR